MFLQIKFAPCDFLRATMAAAMVFTCITVCAAPTSIPDQFALQSPHLTTTAQANDLREDATSPAQAFFLSQRLPEGTQSLDYAMYARAEKQANAMEWYSLSQNRPLKAAAPLSMATLSTWQELGPGNIGGRTRVLRFHPSNPNIMYAAGVAGGVWKTTNGGLSWAPLSDLAANLAIVSLVIDRTNPQRIWAGTGEGVYSSDALRGAGIFLSIDGGTTWAQLSSTNTADFYYVNDLLQSPNNADVLYAATRSGVFRSIDSGTSWNKVVDTSSAGINVFGGCFNLASPKNVAPDTVLATCGTFGRSAAGSSANAVVLRNVNAAGAGTWDSVLSPTNMGRTSLAIAPSNPQIMYALAAAGEQSGAPANVKDGLLGVWRSANGGATWTPMVQNSGTNSNNNLLLSNPLEAHYSQCGFSTDIFDNDGWFAGAIGVDPVNPDRVWVGGVDLWRSDDAGANWGVASYWWFPTPQQDPVAGTHYAHFHHHGIYFHPGYDGVTNKQMVVTGYGGIYKTLDATLPVGTDNSAGAGNSVCGNAGSLPSIAWSSLNNGYAVAQFYDGAVYPGNAQYFGGTIGDGTIRGADSTGPNAWVRLLGGDGGYVAVNPTNTQLLYAETSGLSLRRSVNGGASFFAATSGISDTGAFVTPFVMDGNNPNRLWIGGTKLWRTDDGAASWTRAASTTTSSVFSAFAVAPYYSDLVAAGVGSGRIYVLTSATINTSATPLPAYVAPRSGYLSALAFDPTQTSSNLNAKTLIATYSTFGGAHLFKSPDSGASFASIDGTGGGALPDIPVNTIAFDPTTSHAQRLFVGTDIGVFVTVDGGQTWLRENTGFANTQVRKLVVQYDAPNHRMVLFAFTHGRGAYKTFFAPGDYIFANGLD